MTASSSPARKPRPDHVRHQALQLLATTACSWNLAGHGARAPAGQALEGVLPQGMAHANHPSPAR